MSFWHRTGVADSAATCRKMALLFDMFMLQSISSGFYWTLLPLLMRGQDLSLGAIGLTALIYSPLALKFIWASQVDKHYSRRWGKRKSWIIPLYLLNPLLLISMVFFNPHENLGMTLAIVFLINISMCTADTAVDGYATDILTVEQRALGNTIQMVAYTVGNLLGAGIFLIIYHYIGWENTVISMAIFYALLTIPVLTHHEIQPIASTVNIENHTEHKPSARAFMRLPRVRWFLFFLITLWLVARGGNQVRLSLLVDFGFNTEEVGQLMLWIGSPLSIIGAITGGVLIRKIGGLRVFYLVCAGVMFLNIFTAVVSLDYHCLTAGAIMLGLERIFRGMALVLVFTLIMNMSAGRQSATNYAVLCSLESMVVLVIMPITGMLADLLGYFRFYLGLGAFVILTLISGHYILQKRLNTAANEPMAGV